MVPPRPGSMEVLMARYAIVTVGHIWYIQKNLRGKKVKLYDKVDHN